jgi:hypothetical protein
MKYDLANPNIDLSTKILTNYYGDSAPFDKGNHPSIPLFDLAFVLPSPVRLIRKAIHPHWIELAQDSEESSSHPRKGNPEVTRFAMFTYAINSLITNTSAGITLTKNSSLRNYLC